MQVEVLRLNHRIGRDPRISTHVALTARAFGAGKVFYSGDSDKGLEESVIKITEKFGGPFEIEHVKNDKDFVKNKKDNGYMIIHLTVYGKDFRGYKKKFSNKLLIIVGGEKVEGEFYKMADFNLSVTNQPHSEVAALGVFLYEILGYNNKFKNAKAIIIGKERGKFLKELQP